MRHPVARARAVLLATGRLRRLCDQKHLKSSRQGKDNTSKLRRVQAMGQVLCGPTLHLPLLVNDLLHMNAGYQSGCLVLQCICAVLFRHVLASRISWLPTVGAEAGVGSYGGGLAGIFAAEPTCMDVPLSFVWLAPATWEGHGATFSCLPSG